MFLRTILFFLLSIALVSSFAEAGTIKKAITLDNFISILAKKYPTNPLIPKSEKALSKKQLFKGVVSRMEARKINYLEEKKGYSPLTRKDFINLTFAFITGIQGKSYIENKFFLKQRGVISQKDIGVIKSYEGDVVTYRENSSEPITITGAEPLLFKDVAETSEDSKIEFEFDDLSILTLGEDTVVEINQLIYNPVTNTRNILVKLHNGKLRAKVSKLEDTKTNFNIQTPTAVIGVRGTDFMVDYNKKTRKTNVVTFEGLVAVKPYTPQKREQRKEKQQTEGEDQQSETEGSQQKTGEDQQPETEGAQQETGEDQQPDTEGSQQKPGKDQQSPEGSQPQPLGTPIDPATGLPMVDPATGTPAVPTSGMGMPMIDPATGMPVVDPATGMPMPNAPIQGMPMMDPAAGMPMPNAPMPGMPGMPMMDPMTGMQMGGMPMMVGPNSSAIISITGMVAMPDLSPTQINTMQQQVHIQRPVKMNTNGYVSMGEIQQTVNAPMFGATMGSFNPGMMPGNQPPPGGAMIDPTTGKPMIDPATGMPMMDTMGGMPMIDPTTGLPMIDPATGMPMMQQMGGMPMIDPATGMPMIDPATGMPMMQQMGGMPMIDPATGMPMIDPATGMPMMQHMDGMPMIDPATGMPMIDPATGMPMMQQMDGMPMIDPATGMPMIDPATGMPIMQQMDGMPMIDPATGMPMIDPATGMPMMQQMDGMPMIDPATGMPMIDPATGMPMMQHMDGMPMIDPATGMPMIDPATGMPIMDTMGGMPMMDPATGMPMIDPATGMPMMDTMGGMPMIDPATGMPVYDPMMGMMDPMMGMYDPMMGMYDPMYNPMYDQGIAAQYDANGNPIVGTVEDGIKNSTTAQIQSFLWSFNAPYRMIVDPSSVAGPIHHDSIDLFTGGYAYAAYMTSAGEINSGSFLPSKYAYGLQVGSYIDAAAQVLIEADVGLAYAIQVEEDVLNMKVLQGTASLWPSGTSDGTHLDGLKETVNTLLSTGTLRQRDAWLEQNHDAKSGRVLKDRSGEWVRTQQYVLRPNTNKVQVLDINSRATTGISILNWTTTFAGTALPTSLTTLPWAEWTTTLGTGVGLTINSTHATYPTDMVVTIENTNTNQKISENRTFGTPSANVQSITGTTLTVNNGTAFTLAANSGTAGTYAIGTYASVDDPGNNPVGFQYIINETGTQKTLDVAFYVIGNGTTGSIGLKTGYSGTNYRDIWAALGTGTTSFTANSALNGNNLEIKIDNHTGTTLLSTPLDIVYIPLSNMTWK